jgi:Tol biopolymer transport system component
MLLAAGGLWIFERREIPAAPPQHALTRTTFDEGLQNEPTWSTDGRYIAYSSNRGGKFDIWVQQFSGGDPVQITKGPGHHWQPDWSPDGKYIAYRSEEGKITDSKQWDDKPRWSPDGRTTYFVSRRGGFFNVWGIHFDLDAGKTVGQPFQVPKFESPRLMVPR